MGKKTNRKNNNICAANALLRSESTESRDKKKTCTTSPGQCKHISKAIDQTQIKRNLLSNGSLFERPCQECLRQRHEPAALESLRFCLRCGSCSCGPEGSNHAKDHFDTPRSDSHSLSLQFLTWTVWCYECSCEVDVDSTQKLHSCVDIIKQHYNKSAPTIKVIIDDVSPSSRKEKSAGMREPQVTGVIMNCIGNKTASSPAPALTLSKKKATIGPPKVRGLSNMGNTCFFNSVLQCLAQTPRLAESLSANHAGETFELKLNNSHILNGVLEGAGPVSESLAALLMETSDGKDQSVITPKRLMGALCKKCPQFQGSDQHDAHELLRHLLDTIRMEDLRRYQKIILNSAGLSPKINPQTVDEEKKKFIKEAESRLNEVVTICPDSVFKGSVVSILECQTCHHSSNRTETFMDFSLPVNIDCSIVEHRKNNKLPKEDNNNQPSKHQLKKERKLVRRGRNKHMKRNSESLLELDVVVAEANGKQGNGIHLNCSSLETDVVVQDNTSEGRVQNIDKTLQQKPLVREDCDTILDSCDGDDYIMNISDNESIESSTEEQTETAGRLIDTYTHKVVLENGYLDFTKESNMNNCYLTLLESDLEAGGAGDVNQQYSVKNVLSLRGAHVNETDLGDAVNHCVARSDTSVNDLLPSFVNNEAVNQEDQYITERCSSISLEGNTIRELEGACLVEMVSSINPCPYVLDHDPKIKNEQNSSETLISLEENSNEIGEKCCIQPCNSTSIQYSQFLNNKYEKINDSNIMQCKVETTRPLEEKDSSIENGIWTWNYNIDDLLPEFKDPIAVNNNCYDATQSTAVDVEISKEPNDVRVNITNTDSVLTVSNNNVGNICPSKADILSIVSFDEVQSPRNVTKNTKIESLCDASVNISDKESKCCSQVNNRIALIKDTIHFDHTESICHTRNDIIDVDETVRGGSVITQLPVQYQNDVKCSQTVIALPYYDEATTTPSTRNENLSNDNDCQSDSVDKEYVTNGITNGIASMPITVTQKCERQKKGCSIESCLNQFTTVELLSGSNKVACDSCSQSKNKGAAEKKTVYREAAKQLLINSAPPVLILHLKRFQVMMSSLRKLSQHVTFPVLLDLAPYCTESYQDIQMCLGTDLLYSLYGVVEHSGSISGGHYVAYVKMHANEFTGGCRKLYKSVQQFSTVELDVVDFEYFFTTLCDTVGGGSSLSGSTEKWYCISDSMVREINESRVLKTQAYLLFYKRLH